MNWLYAICLVLSISMVCEIYIVNELIKRMKKLKAEQVKTRKGLNDLIDAFNRHVIGGKYETEDRVPAE